MHERGGTGLGVDVEQAKQLYPLLKVSSEKLLSSLEISDLSGAGRAVVVPRRKVHEDLDL